MQCPFCVMRFFPGGRMRARHIFSLQAVHADTITNKEAYPMIDTISLLLIIIGAVNWLLVGIFQFDLVAWLFGGQAALLSRILYTIIGAAGLWSISLLFRDKGKA